MPESALLEQILHDYCAANGLDVEARAPHDAFCQFAAKWLVENSCLGLGYAASGLNLRFADGRELSLFSTASALPEDAPAVAISTAKEKLVTKSMADTNPAIQITGR